MAYDPPDSILDQWSPLGHKDLLRQASTVQNAPSWVGREHHRRLAAYRILAHYMENSARRLLPTKLLVDGERTADTETPPGYVTVDDTAAQTREYGDPSLLVGQVVAAVLGEDVTWTVEGADEDLPEEGDETDNAPDDGDPETGDQTKARILAARERQAWLDGWAKRETLMTAIHDAERDAVGLGDAVFVLGWDAEARRVVVETYDPGFYFPVFDRRDRSGQYPRKVHLAWEEEEDRPDGSGVDRFVRRITYQLVRRDDPEYAEWVTSDPVMPWHGPEDDPATLTCLQSDGTWPLNRPAGVHVDLLDDGAAEWATVTDPDGEEHELFRYDLGVDFIPVVHMPNTVNRKGHFGRSLLLNVAQILDDLQITDTDLADGARLLGIPPVSIDGQPEDGEGDVDIAPGAVFWGGKLTMMDTSTAGDALLKRLESLQARLSTNVRVPEEYLGRVKAADLASGFLALVLFSPMRALVAELRLAREDKYRILFRFVQRLAQMAGEENGGLPAGELPTVELKFGSFLPSDVAGLATTLRALIPGEAQLLSRATAIRLLQEAGIGVDNVQEEREAIRREDFVAAAARADAVGDDNAAREELGMDPVDPPAPVVQLPPLPGAPAQQQQRPPAGQAPAPAR